MDWPIEFLRPLWLLGIIPLAAAAFYIARHSYVGSVWEKHIEPALRAYVIEPGDRTQGIIRWVLLAGWLVGLIALAGPVWEKKPLPVFKGEQAQVVLFDLSRSMLSDDLKPTRIERARFKLLDFLKRADGVQVALIAFAERPYVISPLSDDANTIASFVESLDPSIMPAQGSRVDLAIEQGVQLLSQAGTENGQVVLFTDSEATGKSISAASALKKTGHLVR